MLTTTTTKVLEPSELDAAGQHAGRHRVPVQQPVHRPLVGLVEDARGGRSQHGGRPGIS